MYKRTFKAFSRNKLSAYLEQNTDRLQSEINDKLEDYILNVNETDYINHLVAKFTVESINIDFEGIFIGSLYEKNVPAEYFPLYRFNVQAGESYPKPAVTYHLPYTGNKHLLQCTPSTRINWTTEVFLENQCLCFEIFSLLSDVTEVTEDLKKEAQRIIDSIRIQLGHLTFEIKRYNGQLPTTVKQLFQKQKQKILDKNQIAAALGVPIKKREDLSETYAIPTPEIQRSVNVEPQVTEVGYKPEPTLPDSVYHDILQTIHDVGKTFERLPSTYSAKDEEALRDHILLYLEPRFKGSATGETFNKTGKTDILIRHENSNAFIAECKFWRGQNAYLDTITQLLGYLTWRDSKSAVVVFVRNKDLSSVLQTAEEVTPNHPNYLGFVDKKEDTWFNYRFHINGDPNREVKLSVLFFHVPEQEGT